MRKHSYDTRSVPEETRNEDARPSKSARKREAQALQELGARLTELPADRLASIELPEELREAVEDCARMRSFGAKRRQLQLIGRIMRSVDADAIRSSLEEITAGERRAAAAHRRAEDVRDGLIAGDSDVRAFAATCDECSLKEILGLIAEAREERAAGRNGTACRMLYRLVYFSQNAPA